MPTDDKRYTRGYQNTPVDPKFAEDIREAWKVVQKLLPRIGHVYPAWDYETGKLMHWCAVVESDGTHMMRREGCVADTPSEALCLAALKAVEATKGA